MHIDGWCGTMSILINERGKGNNMQLDFSNHDAAQDMITIIEKDKGLSPIEAINFCIDQDMYDRILETGWASIALNLWGHGDPEREWNKMETPYLDIKIDESKKKLIHNIALKEKVDIETAVSYFLIFTMDKMGYHI